MHVLVSRNLHRGREVGRSGLDLSNKVRANLTEKETQLENSQLEYFRRNSMSINPLSRGMMKKGKVVCEARG